MKNYFVSLVIPCRNEKNYIGKFLDSLILQSWPKDQMEIVIADGMSEDGTREIIKEYQAKYPYIKLLDNPQKYTPFALNIAIKASRGDVIVRLDSHAKYDVDYIAKCAKCLIQYKADNVGGNMKTIPAKNTLAAKSIALCMSRGLGVGNSYFRKGSDKPMEVDTVFGGCYRREIFDKIGFFNENLKRSQDLELNLRLKRAGGKIILVPEIVSYYYPKATLKEFLIHNFTDGQWAILPFKFTKRFFKLRHYILLIFISLILLLGIASFFSPAAFITLIMILGFYLATVLASSIIIAFEEKKIGLLIFMPIAFLIRHFGYGAGSLLGLTKVAYSAIIKV